MQARDRLHSQDAQKFVDQAAMINMTEIEAANTVQERTSLPAYKEFASMIVTDHTNMGHNLERIAAEIPGVDVPAELDQAHRQKLAQLQRLHDAQFVRSYRQSQIDGLQKAIRIFQNFADGSAGRADLRSWARASLAVLQKHLQSAQNLTMVNEQVGAAIRRGDGRTGAARGEAPRAPPTMARTMPSAAT